jgi:outer membrane immunogenic protein
VDPRFRNHTNVDAFGLFTGQVGYAVNNALFYLKGGAAVTSDRFRTFSTATNLVNSSTSDDTRWGGVVGVGLEYGFAPNWSAAIEYDHLFMQDRTYNFTAPGGTFVGTDRIRQDVDLVTVRVNYRFGGPVVARY